MKINNILSTIKDEFIYGGHLTSFGAMSVVFLTLALLGKKPDWFFLAIAFLGAEIIYSYNRYKEFAINNPWRTDYLRNKIKFIPLFIFIYLVISFGLLAYSGKTSASLFGFFLILLGLLYSIYLKKVTKKIAGFKNIFVSFCWACIVVFSALIASHSIDLPVILIFFFVYFNTFVHEIILDIRDIKEDRAGKLLTLPVFLSRKKLGVLVLILSIVSYVFIILGVYLSALPAISLILISTIFYNQYVFSKIDQICGRDAKYLEIFIDLGKILWFIQIFILINLL